MGRHPPGKRIRFFDEFHRVVKLLLFAFAGEAGELLQ